MKKVEEDSLLHQWFNLKKWKPLPFQEEAWLRFHEGKSGLISVPTGAGKTYAAYLPALSKLGEPKRGLQILYVTPLKALAKDLEQALINPIMDLKLPYKVEKRTGDTPYSQKLKQKKSPPEILLITPESLALLLTESDASTKFKTLQAIIVDEWHELLSTKRGTLLELCLSRLKTFNPKVQIWGLTATIGNIQEAAQALVGVDRTPTLVTATIDREIVLEAILPPKLEELPWAGYLGMRLLPIVLKHLDSNFPTLIFTNTRSQAEKWYQAIKEQRPEWEHIIAIHHSSIDKKSRIAAEEGIKSGFLKFVVCTSSLDLGIDLPIVEKVIQIGSPKSISRLVQRAGRSSHKPMKSCHIAMVPTHALEVIEFNGYRLALKQRLIERRTPLKKCYDVLLQHLVTCAIGGGFRKEQLFEEVKKTLGFCELELAEFEKCLNFLVSGGSALGGYSEYKKLILVEGVYIVEDPRIIRRHKMNIGTIVSDSLVPVKLMKGKMVGVVEESFLTQMQKGDNFLFGGRKLKLVQYRDMTAYVRLTKESKLKTAVWKGSTLPFSAPLGKVLREVLSDLEESGHEKSLLQDLINIQRKISYVAEKNELLIELVKSREGWHLFIYPFEGQMIHEGLALLIAHRFAKLNPSTFVLSSNDYGFEIFSKKPIDAKLITKFIFNSDGCYEEMKQLINVYESSKSAFREIARIGGLVFQGYPGKIKSNRQIQASSGLIFDVLQKYDPTNLLLEQAKNEVFNKYFEDDRLLAVLQRLENSTLVIKQLHKFSPFSLPLFIERVSDRLSTESIIERIKAIQSSWQK